MAREIRIGFIGAGAVNFGGGEGPWDHASRLEQLEGLRVVGVADPNVAGARRKLSERSAAMYRGAEVYADFRDLLAEQRPDAVWIGVPPNAHGTTDPGRDIEVTCAARDVHMFIEKPLAAFRPETVRPVARALAASTAITAVGYMFRYSAAIDRIRDLLADTPGGPKAFIGRYDCAYSEIRKAEWWDVRESGGPIVEQATHFVDLARYLVGDADRQTVQAVSVGGAEPAGALLDVPCDATGRRCDQDVPAAFAHPRVTAAVWKFTNGAVGSLTHGTLLHREKYETELEIWGDGLRIVFRDPYGEPELLVRRPGREDTESVPLPDDDPYLTENRVFVEALRTGDAARIRSSYADAMQTFELSWSIADASARGRPSGSEPC